MESEPAVLAIVSPDAAPRITWMDPAVPAPPSAGLIGFDAEFLALDRAFDVRNVALVHGLAGSGKTSLVAEFARWYARTGGLPDGVVLWTRFDRHRTLARLLDDVIEKGLGKTLRQHGFEWLRMSDAERLQVTLFLLQQVPALWVWDNIEPIAGFPRAVDSPWTESERLELSEFLRCAAAAGAKVLLTSRREEQSWLGDLPVRVFVKPLSANERAEMARSLATVQRSTFPAGSQSAWNALLHFTGGNPMTLEVVVKQALRDPSRLSEQEDTCRSLLAESAAASRDDGSEDRSNSLWASLRYGFTSAFSEQERTQLAVLHLFHATSLRCTCLMRLVTRTHLGKSRHAEGHFASEALFAKASDIGLLSTVAPYVFAIHPALSWLLADVFDNAYEKTVDGDVPRAPRAREAYTRALARWARDFHKRVSHGSVDTIYTRMVEEPNLRHALEIAHNAGWSDQVIGLMQGLRVLYTAEGRWATWERLVDELTPSFVDLVTDEPLTGSEDEWAMINDYRVEISRRRRDLERAERLQKPEGRMVACGRWCARGHR